MSLTSFLSAYNLAPISIYVLPFAFSAAAFCYFTGLIVYNLWFHPLARFPGPLLARSTLLWRMQKTLNGRIHRSIEAGHQKYGPILRVSPNELSFASVTSWKSIYGHRPGGMQPTKSEFYDMYGSGFNSLCIGSERVPEKHRQMKSFLSAAFSTQALLEQEPLVSQIVDAFITRLGNDGGPETNGLNLTKWTEMVAFDVLGEMAFGQSFNCIARGEPHYWQEMIFKHLYFVTVADNLRRLPFVLTVARVLAPILTAVRNKHSQFTRDKVAERMANKNSRKDFMSHLVSKVESGQVDREEMTAHASTLIIAGGETVATFLAATVYYLLKTPEVYDTMRKEIRNRFPTYESINATSAQQLPYLQAVISEGLRIYPPGSQGFPRLSPGYAIDGEWIPQGTEIYTSAWAVTHNPQFFKDPMKFDPSRWMKEKSTDIKEASQPFSLGPRGCLGRNFALVELNLILSKLCWKYDMELMDQSLDWEGQSKVHVMWDKPDLIVRFHLAKGTSTLEA
ncbi:cytochrome P450 [Hypoxylon argillaceum]|nr:cytochrome P450 [Hypoxylon argillaceum]